MSLWCRRIRFYIQQNKANYFFCLLLSFCSCLLFPQISLPFLSSGFWLLLSFSFSFSCLLFPPFFPSVLTYILVFHSFLTFCPFIIPTYALCCLFPFLLSICVSLFSLHFSLTFTFFTFISLCFSVSSVRKTLISPPLLPLSFFILSSRQLYHFSTQSFSVTVYRIQSIFTCQVLNMPLLLCSSQISFHHNVTQLSSTPSTSHSPRISGSELSCFSGLWSTSIFIVTIWFITPNHSSPFF